MSKGIPSPFVVRVHPPSSRFHGTSSIRPVFGMPYNRNVHNVLMPNQYKGIGEDAATAAPVEEIDFPEKHITWDVADGIYRRYEEDGGGIFDNISGLGITMPNLDARTISMFMIGAGAAFIGVSWYLGRKKGA